MTKYKDYKEYLEGVESEVDLSGYNHVFVHVSGGCEFGGGKEECDDQYECLGCGKKIEFRSRADAHLELPIVFYGNREECPGRVEKRVSRHPRQSIGGANAKGEEKVNQGPKGPRRSNRRKVLEEREGII